MNRKGTPPEIPRIRKCWTQKTWLPWATAFFMAAFTARADLTFEDCAEITNGDFELVEVVDGGRHIFEMQITPEGNIFFITFGQGLSVYDAATGTTHTMATSLRSLFGLALDPNFATNHWIYLYHTNRGDGFSELFRVTYNPSTHSVSNEATLLTWEIINPADHDGGSMKFDFAGNLWLSTGDNNYWQDMYGAVNETLENYNSLRTAGNTNHLSGKVLRLTPIAFAEGETPTPGEGSTYSIPAGNFAEYYSALMNWTEQDLAVVRPEIFAMGFRNPFSLNIDYNTGLILEGELGPQAARESADKGSIGGDELNIFKEPGFYGWPMFMGHNRLYNYWNYDTDAPGPWFDPEAPRNTSQYNTGVELLPPPIMPLLFVSKDADLYYLQNGDLVEEAGDNFNPLNEIEQSLMAGPIVKYASNSAATYKLPPHLHKRWIVSDHFFGGIYALELDEGQENILSFDNIVPNADLTRTLDLELAPDGGLYVSAESGMIFRVEFTGECVTDKLSVESPGRELPNSSRFLGLAEFSAEWARQNQGNFFSVHTLQGKKIGEFSAQALAAFSQSLPSSELLIFERVKNP